MFRFSERPGERGVEADDPRLDCAILRPMESDGDHFLAYYLTETDAAAESFKASRSANSTSADPLAFLNTDDKTLDAEQDEDKNGSKKTAFHFVRDYETVKIEQEVPNEFLLVLDDGDDTKVEGRGGRKGKGAYYKNIERKMILKKKRVNVRSHFPCFTWYLLIRLL